MTEYIVPISDEANSKYVRKSPRLPILVRCKDCKFWNEWDMCPNRGDCSHNTYYADHNANWFCADGERKDD